MKRFVWFLALLLVSGCATVSKVDQGNQAIGDRLAVQLDGPWNRFEAMAAFPVPTWTVEGITVDRLQFFVGIKDGSPLIAQASSEKEKRPLTFRAGMQPDEIVALFQALLTADGSTFTLEKVDPAQFLGGTGVRFEFSLIRRVDEVRLSGFGYARIQQGELHAILYQAPRLGFYPRYKEQVEKMAQSASLRG
jgi:hypothetical protein